MTSVRCRLECLARSWREVLNARGEWCRTEGAQVQTKLHIRHPLHRACSALQYACEFGCSNIKPIRDCQTCKGQPDHSPPLESEVCEKDRYSNSGNDQERIAPTENYTAVSVRRNPRD